MTGKQELHSKNFFRHVYPNGLGREALMIRFYNEFQYVLTLIIDFVTIWVALPYVIGLFRCKFNETNFRDGRYWIYRRD